MDDGSFVESYLHQMLSLTTEIEGAFDALAHNDVSSLRISVYRQEFLAAHALYQLRSMAHLRTSPASFSKEERDAIIVAAKRLRMASMKYESLLKRSSRSAALLSLLHRSQSGHFFKENRKHRDKLLTWSCEM